MYQTAVHQGERLEFAPVERVEQPEFSKEEGREGAPTSRDPGDDQLSEYDDDSSDNDSDDFAVEEDGAIIFVTCRTGNSVSFLICIAQNAKWTDRENNKQGFALDVIFPNETVCNFCLKKNVLLFFTCSVKCLFFREL